MQGMAQQLILDRRVGSDMVPDGWFIWAAGNRSLIVLDHFLAQLSFLQHLPDASGGIVGNVLGISKLEMPVRRLS